MRSSKCGTLNYKVQESQVECWKGWRWIKWQSEKQHRWDDCQITGRLFSVCHSDKAALSLSRQENQRRLGGAQMRRGKLFSLFLCPLSVLPQSEQSFQRREGAVGNLRGREHGIGRQEGDNFRNHVEKKTKKQRHQVPRTKSHSCFRWWCV